MSINSIRKELENATKEVPEKIALIDGNSKYSYRELFEKVNQIANYLNELNFPKGSRIGIYSNKNLEKIVAILAILSTDYILVPITRVLKVEQVEYIIKDSGIKCLITDRDKYKKIKNIFNGVLITYESIDRERVSFEELYKCYNKKLTPNIMGHSNAIITYSFASTGFPKGIVMTHRNLIDGARVVTEYLNLQQNDIISATLSLSVDYGLNQIFCAIYNRATLALHTFFLPIDFFNHLIRDRVTILPLMPIHLKEMFEEERLPHPQELENVRVITSSGSSVTKTMILNSQKQFPNAKFYSMHGHTEAFRSSFLIPEQINIRPTSIGKAIPDVELYVINEKGEECGVREVGELIHRGLGIYKGYWNAPEETKKRFKSIKILEKVINLEGELTDEIVVASGDFVYKDEEGYLYFDSRRDDMIKSNGFRINPIEIEAVVYNNIPKIKECAIFSIPNKEIEEEIVMVYSGDKKLTKNEIIFEIKKHLPNHMIPTIIIYKKNLPLHNGKIDKVALKKAILETN